jgi:YidC/Oxa1 family membrane protein insertase
MWDTFVVNPMINALLVLYDLLFNNFFLAIAVFTLAIRFITLPLNLRQQRTTMRMQEIQPEIQAIQKKYKDNPQKMQEEFARIGYNPADSLMGCLPLLLQLPILFGLYSAIRLLLGSTPQSLFDLVQRVNPSLVDLQSLFPIDNQFLWLNLGQPDALFILPVAVFVTSYLQQKLMSPSKKKDDDKKKKKEQDSNPMAGMTQSMQVTMPVMFGFMSLGFPAGLSLYFILANLIGIGQGVIIRRSMDKAREEHELEKSGKKGKVVEAEKIPAPSSADLAVAKSNAAAGSDGKKMASQSANGQKRSNKTQANKSKKSRKRKRR